MIRLFSKESGQEFEVPFFEDETFGITAYKAGLSEKYDIYEPTLLGWEVQNDDEASWWVEWGETAEKAEKVCEELIELLNGEKPYDDFPKNPTFDQVASYFVNDLDACDLEDIHKVLTEIDDLINTLKMEVQQGDIVKHIEHHIDNDLDYESFDVIKGKDGHYFISGEGGPRTIFGKLESYHSNFYIGGTGTFLVSAEDYLRK